VITDSQLQGIAHAPREVHRAASAVPNDPSDFRHVYHLPSSVDIAVNKNTLNSIYSIVNIILHVL